MKTITYEGAVYEIHGELPAVGSRAADVSLVNTRLHDVSLANWLGLRKILYILPSIDLPTCARSVIVFDRLAQLHEDVAALMISYDLPFAHARFVEEHSLKQIEGLSAIRHAGFGQNYGVQITAGPLAGMFACAVVVLDENNTVVHQEKIEDIGDEPDYAAAYRALGITIDDNDLDG